MKATHHHSFRYQQALCQIMRASRSSLRIAHIGILHTACKQRDHDDRWTNYRCLHHLYRSTGKLLNERCSPRSCSGNNKCLARSDSSCSFLLLLTSILHTYPRPVSFSYRIPPLMEFRTDPSIPHSINLQFKHQSRTLTPHIQCEI